MLSKINDQDFPDLNVERLDCGRMPRITQEDTDFWFVYLTASSSLLALTWLLT